mmetsp:Transcript_39602/g.101677  ORF Transcript_39602/g.101677 Transcript_39602/m.101677 type:complete len:230 (-) Transcript_39602:731-1420(-)
MVGFFKAPYSQHLVTTSSDASDAIRRTADGRDVVGMPCQRYHFLQVAHFPVPDIAVTAASYGYIRSLTESNALYGETTMQDRALCLHCLDLPALESAIKRSCQNGAASKRKPHTHHSVLMAFQHGLDFKAVKTPYQNLTTHDGSHCAGVIGRYSEGKHSSVREGALRHFGSGHCIPAPEGTIPSCRQKAVVLKRLHAKYLLVVSFKYMELLIRGKTPQDDGSILRGANS